MNHKWYIVRHIAISSLAISDEMWFLTVDAVVCIPMILTEFHQGENSRNFFKKHTLTNKSNCLTYTVASSFVCTSPLAVITVVGLLDVLMVCNSAESRSLLLTMCILAPESNYKPAFLRLFCWRSWEDPFLRGREECSLVFFLWASVSSSDRSSNFTA